MGKLLIIMLSLSLSGTLFILILLLCKPLYKNRLSRQWQYYIWLIVVARLLLPFTPEISLVGCLFQGVDNAVEQIRTEEQQDSTRAILSSGQGVSSDRQDNIPKEEQAAFMQRISVPNDWLICGFVWFVTAVGFLIRKITIYQSFVKYIKAGCAEVSDLGLWEQMGKLVEQLGIRTTVELYTNSLISSPLLIGFIKPCILIPSAELSDSDFQNTILHELTHFKRGDMFCKWLVQGTICLHWFNPFVHAMGKEINRACEFSCDEAVIRRLGKEAQRAYGDTLLNAIQQGRQYKESLASVTLSENTNLIQERLDAIMGYKKVTKWKLCISIVFAIAILFGAAVTGAYASEETPPPQYKSFPQSGQNDDTQKRFDTIEEYAAFYHLTEEAISSLGADIQKVFSLNTIWPGTFVRREVSQGLYIEFWTRTEKRPTGRYVWSEILLTNGKDDDKQILFQLKTPNLLITNGSISLPEDSAGRIEGWAWSGTSVSQQRIEGDITYIQTAFTVTLTLGDLSQTITPVCTMVSNAPKGNQYRVGLIHAVWNGSEIQGPIPIPQAPGTPDYPSSTITESTVGSNPSPVYMADSVYNSNVVYSPDSNGILTIPFSIGEIKRDTFFCLGQVPCITKNTDIISVEVNSQKGNGICIWVNEIDLSKDYIDSCFLEWRDYETPGNVSGSFNKLREASYNDHMGNFYIYIGAKDGTDLTDVSGTVTIQTYPT